VCLGQNAEDQPQKLSLLRVFEDLYVFVHDFVAEDVGLVPVSSRALPCLHAAALPAHLSSRGQGSGKNSSTAAGFQGFAPQEERQAIRLIRRVFGSAVGVSPTLSQTARGGWGTL
jgi:hypothetical protein